MDDSRIIELYWDRNEDAIAATASKYGSYCASIARNILSAKEDSEECVNDTYLSAWNSMPPNRPAILSSFLGKITRNLAFNRYKHNTAEKRGGGEAPLVLDELGDVVSGRDSVEDEISRQELVSAINAFLKTLSRDKRAVFVCRYWYFDSVSEIASRFGMTENSVYVTLSRLREKLRIYLNERGFDI